MLGRRIVGKSGIIFPTSYGDPGGVTSTPGPGAEYWRYPMHLKSTPRRGSIPCICQQCGSEFSVFPSDIARGGGKLCSQKCTGRWLSATQTIPVWTRVSRSLYLGPPSPERPDLGPCWLSTMRPDSNGYVGFRRAVGLTDKRLHDLVYERLVGPVPIGQELDHLCRVRGFCCPFHLEAVTHRVNVRRGSSPAAVNAARSACAHGHPFDEANTYYRTDNGCRQCRACKRIRMASARKLPGFETEGN